MRSRIILGTLLALAAGFLVACSAPMDTSTPDPITVTATIPSPTKTPMSPPAFHTPTSSPTATVIPVDGFITTQVYVRTGPGRNFDQIGLINLNQVVKMVGKDASGEWYQIIYPESPAGTGWIAAQYVQASDAGRLPVIDLTTTSGTRAVTAQVVQRLNVRAGPGLSYAVLGIVDPPATLILTGKNQLGNWIQVEYEESPIGFGWVAVAYIRLTASADLPILDELGTPLPAASGQPTLIPVTPTPTVGPAFWDNDSAASPGGRVVFSPLGERSFSYSSDLSAPQGDPDDWLEFTLYGSQGGTIAMLKASLTCTGNGLVELSLTRDGVPAPDWGSLACGEEDMLLRLPSGMIYLAHLNLAPGDGLRFVHYTLTIRNMP